MYGTYPKSQRSPIIASLAMIGFLLCILCTSCNEKESEFQEVTTPRFAQPLMAADSVVTIISDSGVTRYRISTSQWNVYDHVADPYWDFPQGIKLERFDTLLHIDARMWADTAHFLEKKALWEFRGHVSARNLRGEVFETSQLFSIKTLNAFIRTVSFGFTSPTRFLLEKVLSPMRHSPITRSDIRKVFFLYRTKQTPFLIPQSYIPNLLKQKEFLKD